MLLQRKAFLVSASATLLVFSLLLLALGAQVFTKERERPRICDCFVYDGDFESLKVRLQKELAYVDRVILIQSVGDQGVQMSPEQKRDLQSSFKDNLVTITTSHTSSQIEQSDYLKGLFDYTNRDVILLSSPKERVDFKALYESLEQISKDKRVFALKDAKHQGEAIRALNYKLFKNLPSEPLKQAISLERFPQKKRRFFFQTAHHKPMPKSESCSCF